MLRDSIQRAVKKSWSAEVEQHHSKLKVVREMMKSQCKTIYWVKEDSEGADKTEGGETTELRVETGRRTGLRREERICKQCWEVELVMMIEWDGSWRRCAEVNF